MLLCRHTDDDVSVLHALKEASIQAALEELIELHRQRARECSHSHGDGKASRLGNWMARKLLQYLKPKLLV